MFKHRYTEKNVDQSYFCVQQRGGYGKSREHSRATAYSGVIVLLLLSFTTFSQSNRILKKDEIRDGISPKSVVASGHGLFAAQNMMYRHTITLYDASGRRKAKIRDEVNLRAFGFSEYSASNFKGGPVEAAFTKDGKYLWVSNYSMIGEGFDKPGCDGCHGSDFDPGFLYKINTSNYEIENVVKVGSVPKFLAISDDQQTLIVSNWSSGDVSIVDLNTEEEVKKVKVGAHPRGVDITADSKTAFVTVMGSTKIAEVNLESYDVTYINDVGKSPRSLILADHDSTMYISLNSGSKVLKYNRYTGNKSYCKTAAGPRSMCITPDEDFIYVVNYFDHSFSKIRTHNMQVIEQIKTADKPIGICGNWDDSEIWVACYSGRIEIFKDFHLDSLKHGTSMLGFDLSAFWTTTHSNTMVKMENEKQNEKENENENDENENEAENEMPKERQKQDEHDKVNEVVSMESVMITRKAPLEIVEKDRFSKTPNQSAEQCKYHVIAGSFSVPENAQKRREELVSKGYAAIVINGKLNYVSAVCYADRSSAENGVNQVKANTGYSCWILKR